MPDLLTHVLLAYCLAKAASWRYPWLGAPFVTVVMAGAMIPDVAKVELVLPGSLVAATTGLPFSWFHLHTVGGVALSILLGGALVGRRHRRRVVGLLAAGAGSHLVLDALLRKSTGLSEPMLWPLTWYRLPSPGLYTSIDAWPTVLALLLAASVWAASRYGDDRRIG